MDDTQPVIRLFFARIKQAFIDLPDAEKMEFMATDRKNLDALGMEAVTMINCSGLDQEWDYIGVEKWPSMDAIRQREKFEQEVLGIDRYVTSKTHLGTPESFGEYGKG